jgi:hypothetical protein
MYRLFGVDLASDFPFSRRLPAGTEPADLTFLVAREPAPLFSWDDFPPVYRSRYRTAAGESATSLHRLPHGEILRFPLVGDFYLGGDRITCHLPAPAATSPATALVEISLLGPVFAYWLERRHLLTLHASVVGFDRQAVAFLSGHGGGKSGLAAQMMRFGGALLADDLAVLEEDEGELRVRPAYPWMRMWPDEADHFLGHSADLPLVHPDLAKRWTAVGPGGFGDFSPCPLPLTAVYVAQRREDGETGSAVEMYDLSRTDALIELVRHSFAPELLEASGLQPRRLNALARLVQRIPVRRLVYPSGFNRLPEVAAAVLRAPRTSSKKGRGPG